MKYHNSSTYVYNSWIAQCFFFQFPSSTDFAQIQLLSLRHMTEASSVINIRRSRSRFSLFAKFLLHAFCYYSSNCHNNFDTLISYTRLMGALLPTQQNVELTHAVVISSIHVGFLHFHSVATLNDAMLLLSGNISVRIFFGTREVFR